MRQVGEPSVEEILESIKKVIARDNRAEAAQVRARREEAGAVTAQAAQPERNASARPTFDILELTESELAASPSAFDEAELEDARMEQRELDERDREEQSMEERAAAPLVPEAAAASMRDSLAALAMLAQPGVPPQIVRSGETSLEGLTRELLRPMLAEWLEKNLPAMVEKMVSAEIARIAGKRG